MRNLEVKVKILNKMGIVNLLKKLGAEHVCTMKQTDYYFCLGANKEKLRTINDCEHQLIIYRRAERQGRKDSEYEISELNEKEKNHLLESRKIIKDVEKIRELWKYGHTRIHIDHVKHLGNFLELETVIKDISLEGGENEFRTIIDKLQINLVDSVPASYSDLV
ncbi:MAG: class IV adenylate cyclase [Gracilibacteraceae bacterium]|jgi:predicted adenylyl cyclase CyaB|nr:class IV adenylate cyclase [Gracilibacteraceae bacterium]